MTAAELVTLAGPVLAGMVARHADEHGLTLDEAAADLMSAGVYAVHGPSWFPVSWLVLDAVARDWSPGGADG